ncbi:PX domain [Popillia japonica]|uniref:PX domain n=1 Tax=Popillia japonica TaxID=7064 RepID=A0AAW1LLL2_POPJA
MCENPAKSKKLYLTGGNLKEDTLLRHGEISVSESEKRANGSLNLREYYTVYLIETKATDPEFQNKLSKLSAVWRRYTEFEQLRDYLEHTYPFIVIPPLPEKRVLFSWQKVSTDTFDPDFVDRRRAGLETFLLRIASHPVLSYDKHFIEFLQNEDGWRETFKSNGYLQIAENKLKALSVSVRLKNTDPRFESIKTYGNTLHTSIYNLLKARSRVAEKQYTVYKLHANYGRVFSEWSAIEKEMGDALQKTGHYLDSLSSSIDSLLEDEELLVDQFKEYLFFASSLQNLCKHQELLQLKLESAEDNITLKNSELLESAEDNITLKNSERVKAQQGKMGIMSRLFGTIDTDEVRELKDGEVVVGDTKTELTDFCTKASADIDRFQSQKCIDLKETLAAYAFLQLKTARKGLQTWTQIRDCLQNIP